MTEEAQTQDVKLPEPYANFGVPLYSADQVRAAVMAERERAAKLVDALADDLWSDGPIGIRAEQCAAAIRSGS